MTANAFAIFKKLCHREYLLQVRQPKQILNLYLFFAMVLIFFPLTLPAHSPLLQQFASGLIWIALELVLIGAADRFFQTDFEEGVLDQYLVSGYSLIPMVLAKLLLQSVFMFFALLLLSPFFSLLFAIPWRESLILLLSLSCSMPAILALCSLASACTVGRQQKGFLIALIVLPLTLPLMILGSMVLTVARQGLPISGYLVFLVALSILALSFLPAAIAYILRVSVLESGAP